ncbi:peptidoglycan-binding domain-containing protein [Alkalilacustris brevis]|uniref:peptidoglycan-binding domain-containing protein n=1 Tax=Alkalilacustris brevis TaxID=2026338 RepID=UPI000E0D36D3|nr:peptidoglycan-binding domain-containing protein [Alkalilacustris brevis]
MTRTFLALGLSGGLLAACGTPVAPFDGAARDLGQEVVRTHDDGPSGARPGTCWGQDVTPAVVETVTEQVILQPPGAEGGGATVYRTETHQSIVQERQAIWFRTPCEHEMTAALVETLQRALRARGLYDGPINGQMDAPTRRAVRAYQRAQGLNSGLLSLTAARQLGLVEYDFSEG